MKALHKILKDFEIFLESMESNQQKKSDNMVIFGDEKPTLVRV